MLWYKKQADGAMRSTGSGEIIAAGELSVEFDKEIAGSKLKTLLEHAEEVGGIERLIDSLEAKSLLFKTAFPVDRSTDWRLDAQAFDTVTGAIFPVRRKIAAIANLLGREKLTDELIKLVYGAGGLSDRMLTFAELVPEESKKERRAMRDFAAEILHFRDPDGVPLMTRWVWDESTASGALREFIRGNDGLPEIAIDSQPPTFQGARAWFAEMLAESGFYRGMPMLIDLLLAQAYSDYVKAMSSGLGLAQAEFGNSHHPIELLVKLLGIDPKSGRGSKTREPTLH
ncbi:hypothetical protein BJI67_04075 [Acidihalobacter aeolianus]|uniref:Uncharacterized protein n=1 Tax=Acidihalobacter aeolianus TaxID=2792603 RepID=A0A1D8K5W7_9GAMM|nr:hypothetical protein [Acidihalobacter aeolianus]AOV16354.1 hypothetical protein BJI67_04075 [Acidihalobacter aeolianus]